MLINLSWMKAQSKILLGLSTLFVVMAGVSACRCHMGANTEKENMTLFLPYYQQWTNDFNAYNLEGTCGFFAKNLSANTYGIDRDYQSQCDVFKRIFAEKDKQYRYHFELHQIYHEKYSQFASVRVSWFLDATDKNRKTTHNREEGLDVLQKTADGKWEIINYVGFSLPATS